MDDPDGPRGTWDHWMVWNIPPQTTEIAEGKELEGVAGKNSWGKTGYGGPCPPKGVHRYRFRLYALGVMLDLPPDFALKPDGGTYSVRELAFECAEVSFRIGDSERLHWRLSFE